MDQVYRPTWNKTHQTWSPASIFTLLVLSFLLTGCKDGSDNDPSAKLYTVSVGAANNGTLSPAPQQVKAGEIATVTVTPDSGFGIASASGCGGTLSGTTYTTAPITSDCRITASFTIVLNVSGTAPHTLTFSWSASPGADHYKLLVRRDGASDYVQSGSDITGNRVDVLLPGQPLDWVNAKYILQAYDSSDTQIGKSSATCITTQMLSHPDTTGASDDFGWSATLSSDGKSLAVGVPAAQRNNAQDSSKTASPTSGVYLFQRDASGSWTQQAYVKSANNGTGDKWASHIDLEAKLGNKRSLGEADLFVPIDQSSRRLAFADVRGRFDDKSSHEFNLGLGLRSMRNNGWNLGLYGYLDRRTSENGYDYNQATLGVEALGTDWDFRANGYASFGTHAHALGSTSTASLAGASIQVETDIHEERALSGMDAEVGWRTPLYDSEAQRQLRIYAGGYRFSGGGLTVQGPRLRAELEMDDLSWFGGTSRLYVGAEVQRDDTRGTQSFVSARLRIPLGGREEQPHLTLQARRMSAPVVRDVDILTVAGISRLVETATTARGQPLTVVNSATTSGAGLQSALDNAGNNSTVIINGDFSTTNTVHMSTGQTLFGAGTLNVRTASGHTATLTTPGGSISTGTAVVTLTMADNTTLSGMTITNFYAAASGNAVSAQGTTGVTIRNNTITAGGASGGYTVDLLNATNATVSGNTITATTSSAVASATGIRVQGAANSTIANNTFSMSGTTMYVIAGSNTSSFAAGSTGNVTNAGVCFFVGTPTGSVGFSTITCP